MTCSFRFLGLLFGAALSLSSLILPAAAQVTRTAIPESTKTATFDGFAFPRQIAGLTRNYRLDYPGPGLGFSISYGKHGAVWADIYIYDREQTVSSDPTLPPREVEAAIDEIHYFVKQGRYESAVIEKQSVSGPFAKAHLKITAAGRERDSFVFVTVRKGKFVKIRLTTEPGTGADAMAERFAREYARTLGKS